MPSAIIILADGFEEIEAVTCIDLLRRSQIEVTVLGLESLDVRGSHDICIRADMLFGDFTGRIDALILPGGMPGSLNLFESDELKSLIKKCDSERKLCAAICAAPIVLAEAGVLNHKKATCYPGFQNRLHGAVYHDESVLRDGHIITARSAGSAVDFSLQIIRYLCGTENAEKIGSSILYEN